MNTNSQSKNIWKLFLAKVVTVIVAVTEIVSGQEAETEGDQDLEIGKN